MSMRSIVNLITSHIVNDANAIFVFLGDVKLSLGHMMLSTL